MKQRLPLFLALLALAAAFAGCNIFVPPPKTVAPLAALNSIAVAPFINDSQEKRADFSEFERDFSARLAASKRFESVVMPSKLAVESEKKGIKLDPRNTDKGLAIAKELKCDALIIVRVTDFSPWRPKKIQVEVTVHGSSAARFTAENILAAETRGIALPRPGYPPEGYMWKRVLSYDTFEGRTIDSIHSFAKDHLSTDYVHGWEIYLASTEKFLEFCAYEIAHNILRDAQRPDKNQRDPEKEAIEELGY